MYKYDYPHFPPADLVSTREGNKLSAYYQECSTFGAWEWRNQIHYVSHDFAVTLDGEGMNLRCTVKKKSRKRIAGSPADSQTTDLRRRSAGRGPCNL